MTENRKKWLRRIGLSVFALFCFLFFIYLGFPVEALEGRMSKELAKQAPNIQLSFSRASLWRLSGLDLEEVKVTMLDSGEPLELKFDRLRARVQLLPLISKRTQLSFIVSLGSGSIEGDAAVHATGTSLKAKIDSLNLLRPPLLAQISGVAVSGELDGEIEIALDNDPKKTNGRMHLELRKGMINESTLKGFTLPATDIGNADINVEITEGTASAKKFSIKGNDIDLNITGDMQIRRPMTLGTANLTFDFKPSDGYLQKNVKIQTILQLASVQGVRKTPDGTYNYRATGPLGNLLRMPGM